MAGLSAQGVTANNAPLRTETVGTGPRIAWFLHGIFGQGRNWRSFAVKWLSNNPDFRAVLPDLRGHGGSLGAAPPHNLATCAADLEALPAPDLVVGHSFGGKVALTWAALRQFQGNLVIVDAPPGVVPMDRATTEADPRHVLTLLRSAPNDRAAARAHLLAAGLGPVVVDWLLLSLQREGNGWEWQYDLDAIHGLLNSYFTTNCWPALDLPRSPPAILVIAGRGGRWTAEELSHAGLCPGVRPVMLPSAGHWVHVDAPDALRSVLDAAVSPTAAA